jgi:formylglycine-generating enzyme required for sulfatase activity
MTEGMVWVPGGGFLMGSDEHYPEEAPAHEVTVDGFWMDQCAVTNAQFRRFVAATGHVTVAERPPDPAEYPGADPARLAPASAVFRKLKGPVDLRDPYQWWIHVPGASWRHPRGPQSSLKGLDDHPVVHVAWADVAAYAAWAGKALPTEAEWERAARGGLEGAEYAWGDELTPAGRHMANVWQGEFPQRNECLDGYEYTAPVRSFPPNGYGLFEMTGNVWEWTADWYQDHGAGAGTTEHACCTVDASPGAEREASVDARDPARIPRRVMKGGSHLCAPNYCRRYRPAARMAQAIDTSTSHLGFRCIVRPGT